MKRLFFNLITISLYFNCVAADKDQAYQNYLQRCAQVSDLVFEHLPIKDLAKIVHDYNRISYKQWQKNGQDLIEAAQYGNLSKVKELIEEAEVDIDAKDSNDWSVLMVALSIGHKDIAELLINAKADVNARNNCGVTTLMSAVNFGHKEIVELLINAGADVNAKEKNGCTALMWASSSGLKEIVELLINAKADINAKCDGRTALNSADEKGYKEIVELLKKAGAQ